MGLSAVLSTQVIDTTSVGRSVMTAADAAAARAAIGAGASSFDGAFSSLSGKPTTLAGYGITDAQPLDSDLTAIAALTTTTYGRSLLTGADAAATRTTLGLGTLATQSGTFSGTSSGTNTGDQTITLTGDVTGSGTGSFAATIGAGIVTNAKLANVATSTIKGRVTAGTGSPEDLTGTQATTLLDVFTSSLKGLAPASGGGTTNFLRADGTWAAPSAGSGLTSLNGQTGSTQTFQTATTGTDFTISSTGNVHTFAIPDASASARGLVTTGTQTFAGQKTFAQGTLTASAPLTLTQTWNNAAVAFTAFDINITATAQNVSSNAMTLRQGGTNLVLVRAGSLDTNTSGNSILQVCHPTAYAGHAVLGWRNPFQNGAGVCGDVFNSTSPPTLPSVVAGVVASSRVSTVPSFVITDGTNMARYWVEADNSATQRNSTNAQTVNIANTWTSSTSFEYGRFQWNTNEFRIGTAVGSAGGTQRNLVLGTWNSAGTWTPMFTLASDGSSLTYTNSSTTYPRLLATGSGTATGVYIGVNYGANNVAFIGTQAAAAADSNTTNAAIGSGITGGGLGVYTSSSTARKWFWDAAGNVTASPVAATSGSQTGFLFTAPAPTGQTASTEATMVNWNLASTVTFAAGALTTQRAFRIQAPTYAFASASTITTASTLSISGAPIAGTNATITNAWALTIESGNLLLANGAFSGAGIVFSNTGSLAPRIIATGSAGSNPLRYRAEFHEFVNEFNVFSMSTGGSSSYGTVVSNSFDLSFGTGPGTKTLSLWQDANDTLAQRRGTNAQTFRVYNTFTSTTSNEFITVGWATNVAQIGTVKGSAGGSARDLALQTDGTTRISISGTTGDITVADSENIIFGTTTGTRLGTSTSQRIGFWNATPIVQPTTAGAAATRTGGGGAALTDTDTFDGYTVAQVVRALRNLGVLA